jgi:AAHS family 4-hydroxybenzoate transporter-like MFS transporter
MESAAATDVRQFVDEQPVSRYQLWVAVMCGAIVFIDGFDAQAMGFVAPALTSALGVSRAVLGPVISSGLFGMMFGALIFGPVADRFGRKPVLVASALIFGVGSLLTATATTIESLSLFRVLTGLGMGGAMPNAIALTSEYMPSKHRSTAVTAMICGFSLGAAAGGFVAAELIPRYGWQSVFITGGVVPILIAAAAAAWLPESIRFLLLRGNRQAQAARYLGRIAPHVAVPAALAADRDDAGGTHGGTRLVRELFSAGRGPVTILIWVVYFMNLLNLYFLNSWLPTIMSDAGIRVETAIRVTALFQVGGIVGALGLGRVLDHYRSFRVLAV